MPDGQDFATVRDVKLESPEKLPISQLERSVFDDDLIEEQKLSLNDDILMGTTRDPAFAAAAAALELAATQLKNSHELAVDEDFDFGGSGMDFDDFHIPSTSDHGRYV